MKRNTLRSTLGTRNPAPIIVVFFLMISWLMQGCEREMMDYQGKPGIYFAVQHGFAGGNETIWPYQPLTNIEFFKIM